MSGHWLVYVIAVALTMAIIVPIWLSKRRDERRLKREQKYGQALDCQNCKQHHYFEIPIGTCMDDFLKDKKCTNCKCELKRRISDSVK